MPFSGAPSVTPVNFSMTPPSCTPTASLPALHNSLWTD